MITISWWDLGFLLIIFSNNLFASSIKQADSLFSLGLYPDACIAYERIIYEHPEDEFIKANALLKKSYCYKAERNYLLIDNLLNRCNINGLNDTFKSQILFEQAFACYMNEKFSLAKSRILPVFNLNTTPELEKASVFLYSLILNELNSWDESKKNLISFIKRTEIKDEKLRDNLIKEVDEMYQKKNIPKIRKLKFAKTLSFILPGSGQAYSGKAVKGLISLSLASLAGAFTYFNFVDEIYSSSAAGLFFFTYFYFGNVKQVTPIVNKRNTIKKNKCNAILRTQLINLNKHLDNDKK